MTEDHAGKRMLFRELLRLVHESPPASEALVMASLGGEGFASELREELNRAREHSRLWFIERSTARAESLRRLHQNGRIYQGPLQRFPLFFDRSKETGGIHLVHWDLTGMAKANIQEVARVLPLVWRSETRLLAVTVDDGRFTPLEADPEMVVKVAEGFFETNFRFVWSILLELYGEGGAGFTPGGADPRVTVLRELTALLAIIMAPVAEAAVSVSGHDLGPLELLHRLSGVGSRAGWFMDAARRHMTYLPTNLVRYVVRGEGDRPLWTYVFRYVRASGEVWDKLRSWEWLLAAPLVEIVPGGTKELREARTHVRLTRPDAATVEITDLLADRPLHASVLGPENPEEPEEQPWVESEEPEQAVQPAMQPREDKQDRLESRGQPDEPPHRLEEKMADLGKVTAKVRDALGKRRPSKAAPAAAEKPVPSKKTEADAAYDRLLPLKDLISPYAWQSIEILYREAKRERRPDHSKRIATLEGLIKTNEALIAELREEQGGKEGAAPAPRPSAPARRPAVHRAVPAKPAAAKPKPAGQNGKGNGADLEQQVLNALKGKGKMRTEQLTKALGMERSGMYLRRLLMRLRAEGKIKMDGQKRGSTYELVA